MAVFGKIFEYSGHPEKDLLSDHDLPDGVFVSEYASGGRFRKVDVVEVGQSLFRIVSGEQGNAEHVEKRGVGI